MKGSPLFYYSLSIYLSIYLSLYISLYIYISIYLYISLYISIYLYISLYISLSLYISIYLPPSPLSYISSPTLSCLAGLRWPFPSISYLPPRLWPCRGLPVFSRYSGGVLPCAFAVGDDVGDNLLFPLLQHRGRSWEKCDMRAAGTKKEASWLMPLFVWGERITAR